MKKWIRGILAFMLILTVAFLGVSLSSCSHKSGHTSKAQLDSIYLQAQLKRIANPTFTTVEDVLDYHAERSNALYEDSVFIHMDEQSLRNVSIVLQNRKGKLTKSTIVHEYISNKDVYDNLNFDPDTLNVVETDSTITYSI